jgi:hypothetical protein
MNEQITLIFLVFIVVIISAMVYKLPMNAVNMALLVGVLSTFLINKADTKSGHSHETNCDHVQFTPTKDENTNYQSMQMANGDEEPKEETYQNVEEAENQFSEKDFDVALYNNYNSVKGAYYDMACPGDNALTDRMLEQGKRPQQATDARAKFDKYSMLQYLDEELNSTANCRWWDNDALEHMF